MHRFLIRSVAVGVRPQRLGELILPHTAAAESDERLQQRQRLFLRLARENYGPIVDEYLEASQSEQFDCPWPCLEVDRRLLGLQMALAD